MADCAYTFTGPDGKPLTIVGVPGLKAYLVDGGLEHLFPERKFPLKAVALFSRGETTQEDLFKGDFATKRTTVSRTEVISSKGDTATVKKPNIDSQGRQISTTKSGLERFWDFYKNGPVDSAGRPILLYHSTNSDIAVFEKGRVTTNNFGLLGDVETSRAGVFAAPDLSFSQDYLREGAGQNVMPVFMALQNPLDLRAGLSESDEQALEAAGINVRMIYQTQNDWELFDNDEDGKNDFVSALEKAGYDGAIISEEGQDGKQHDTYVAFRNTQIKSAIGNQGSFSPEDADIRYSTAEKPTRKNTFNNQAEAEEHLSKSFGPGIKNLISSNVLNFTQGKAGWPDVVQNQLRGGEEAVYVNGKAYIDLQAVGKDRLDAVALHEIGEHFNLKLMLGPEGYKSLQDQITNRAKIKGSQAEKTWERVKNLYPDLKVGSEEFVAEVIAKLGEANPNAPWYRRLLTRIRAFLTERGLAKGFGIGAFTEADMHDLLRTSLMSAAGRYAQGEARIFGEGVMASIGDRLYRAKLLGFDTDTVYYHGTDAKEDFDEFDPVAVRKEGRRTAVDKGISFSTSKDFASKYAQKEGGRVIPVFLRKRYLWTPNAEGIEDAKIAYEDKYGEPMPDYVEESLKGGHWSAIEGYISQLADYGGYDSFEVTERGVKNVIVLNPADVRSVNAEFNIAEDESGKLLASRIENLQPAPEERSSLWDRWFGKSKMQRGGQPIKFYHGSQAEFTVFDKSRLATNTTHTTAGLGHFFTENPEEAYRYGGNVKEVFLSIQKPYVANSWDLDSQFSDAAGAAKFREKLQAEGYDGIYIKDAKYAVTFESNQAKLTENKSPTFGEDVRFSRVGKQPWEMTSEEYETPTDLKPQQSFYVNAGGRTRIEIIRNPSSSDLNALKKEAIADYGEPAPGDPSLRFTADAEGNKYYWKAAEGVHAIVEPAISRLEGVQVNQNADYRPSHRMVVRRALYNGESIPANVLAEYPGLEDEVREIPGNKVAGGARFSRVEDFTEATQNVKASADKYLNESWSSVWGQRLSLLSARMIAEYAQKPMPKISKFIDAMQARTAVRDNLLIKGDRILKTKWRTLSRPEILGLNQVMQKTTLQDVNVSREWSGITDAPPGLFKFRVYTQAKLNQDNKNQFANYLKGLAGNKAIMNGQNADFAADSKHLAEQALVFLHQLEVKQAESRRVGRNGVSFADENIKRLATHKEQREKFLALPKKAQEVYSETHNLLTEIFEARVDELVKKIDAAVIDVKLKTQLKTELRKQYESKSLSHYYAPLGRKGDNWFYGKDALGNNWFSTFETTKQRDKALEDFLKAGGTEIGQGSKLSGLESLQRESIVSEGFVQQINELLDKKLDKSIGGPIMDEIYDMFLESLPEVSMRHSSQHRQGVLGYNEDQMQSFSTAVHHGASQLANMRHGKEMLQVLVDHREAKDIAEFPRRLRLAEDDIAAAELMAENWEELSEEGYIEYKMTQFEETSEDGVEYESDGKFENVSSDVWELALQLRNKFGNLELDDAQEGLTRYKDRKREIIEMSKAMKKEDLRKVADVILELDKTYTSIVASTSSPMDRVAAWIKQVNFIYGLGFSLSGGAVNMLQTPIVAMPVSIGRYGVKRTVAAYNEAYKDFASAIKNSYHRNDLGEFDMRDEDGNSSLTVELKRKAKAAEKLHGPDSEECLRLNAELLAMRAVKEEGDISRTNSFDLMGIGREGETYGGRLQDFSKWAGGMFHHGERMNREITIRANYRLAFDDALAKVRAESAKKEATTGEKTPTSVMYQMASDEALKYARQVNNRAHGDYSSENTARIFRSWPAQIALQYKKYPQLMLWVWGTSAIDAVRLIKNRNNAEAREGARTFMALFAMQATFAGVLGLPLIGTVKAVINGLAALFDDDDEPFDAEEQLVLGLRGLIGNKAAEAITDGVINAFTGVNISSRIALKDIVFREGLVEAEGRDEALQLLGDLGGPTGGLLQRLFEAKHLLNEGKVLRAAENAMPKAISDLLKAGRFFSEDAVSLSDQHVKDMTDTENFLIAAGFGSQELSKVYQERNYVMRRKNAIESTYQSLMHKAATAEQKGDEIDWDSIEAFNEKYPMKQITMDKIRKSIDRREDYAERSEDRGYAIDPKLEFLYEEYDLDDSED